MRIEPGYVEIVATVLRELGHDPTTIPLPSVGTVSEETFRQMSEMLVAITQEPSVALRLGTNMHLGTHGLLGHAILSSRSLRQAASLLIQYSPLHGGKGRIQLSFTPDHALLTFEPPFEVEGAPGFLAELFFASMLTALRQLIGPLPEECRLEFSHQPAMPEERYRHYLGIHVSFGHEINRFVGPSARIDQRLAAASIPVAEMYRLQCERLLRDMETAHGLGADVRRMLLVERGRLPSMADAASRMNMSERTLRRRLADDNTSYRAIMDDVRSYMARNYLRETPLSVADIAALLGFDDAANFRRAFRKWNGMTPQNYRQQALRQNETKPDGDTEKTNTHSIAHGSTP